VLQVPTRRISRRELLKYGAIGAATGVSSSLLQSCGTVNKIVSGNSSCAKITDIEHVVILMQENRSFDHYFGSYRGVRGFSDNSAAFQQSFPGGTASPAGVLLPFHLDTVNGNAACTHDITHDWAPQHQSWNNGVMDGFVTAHMAIDGSAAPLAMGYYTRADLAYYYALADAFTICDNFFCSVMGPTDPNRLYSVAASIDPDGKNGGPVIQTLIANRAAFLGKLTYTTMPEQLETRGISWKIYNSPDQGQGFGVDSDNVLPYFKQYQDPTTSLYKKAFGPQFPTDFLSDAASGNLPQVSWIVASLVDSEHPPLPALFGEATVDVILKALTANSAAWAKTVLFLTYDENGGFFDHVPPPTAPLGTPGEYLTVPAVPDPTIEGNPPITGPIGLGFRVPTLIVSPFSRGGFVSSGLFDHTSILRFIETRFGAEVPNLSAWRRSTVGDMTSAFNFTSPDPSVPTLPSTSADLSMITAECAADAAGFIPITLPDPQVMPVQESGSPRRPSGTC
jgi:phospholipase C